MKIIAVMPAYNEEVMIVDVVNETRKYVDDIIVVDDCSTDRTFHIIQGLGVKWVLHNRNYGAGRATKNGINTALRHKADVVITLDSDGQHVPKDIQKLLYPIVMNKADVVIGSRFIQPLGYEKLKELKMIKVPKYREFGIKVITWFFNFGSKQKIKDSQCCFRAFNKRSLQSFKIEENGFGFTCETLIKCRKAGLRIQEVPVTCIYHSVFRLNSSMNPIKQAFITIIKTLYWRLKLWS